MDAKASCDMSIILTWSKSEPKCYLAFLSPRVGDLNLVSKKRKWSVILVRNVVFVADWVLDIENQ